MRCTSCDHLNPDDARFCTGCGAAIAPSAPAVTTRIAPPAAPVVPAAQFPAVASPVAPGAAPGFAQTINVTVQAPAAAPAPSPVVVLASQAAGPGCLVRALYFCFVGLWLGAIWTGLAWFLLVSIVGLPLGLLMLNRMGAESHHQMVLELSERQSLPLGVASALHNLGLVAAARGEGATARDLVAGALARYEALGHEAGAIAARTNLAHLAAHWARRLGGPDERC